MRVIHDFIRILFRCTCNIWGFKSGSSRNNKHTYSRIHLSDRNRNKRLFTASLFKDVTTAARVLADAVSRILTQARRESASRDRSGDLVRQQQTTTPPGLLSFNGSKYLEKLNWELPKHRLLITNQHQNHPTCFNISSFSHTFSSQASLHRGRFIINQTQHISEQSYSGRRAASSWALMSLHLHLVNATTCP